MFNFNRYSFSATNRHPCNSRHSDWSSAALSYSCADCSSCCYTCNQNCRYNNWEKGSISDRKNYTRTGRKTDTNPHRKTYSCTRRKTLSSSCASLQTRFPSIQEPWLASLELLSHWFTLKSPGRVSEWGGKSTKQKADHWFRKLGFSNSNENNK